MTGSTKDRPSIESFAFSVRIECSACGGPTPVDGVVDRVDCRACGAVVRLDEDFWTLALQPECFRSSLEREPGQLKEFRAFCNHSPRVTYGRAAPGCQSCGGPPFDVTALMAAGPGSWTCPGCGLGFVLRTPDELALAVNPAAVLLVDGARPTSSATATTAKGVVVPFYVLCSYRARERALALLTPDDAKLQAAAEVSIDLETCRRLAMDRTLDVRRTLAGNRSVPPSFLAQLAGDRESDVRRQVARNLSTSVPILVQLTNDQKTEVVGAALSNPHIPAELLSEFAASKWTDVVEGVALNPSAPSALLFELARRQTQPRILIAVARNGNTPVAALRRLARDSYSEPVARVAQQRLSNLEAQGIPTSWFACLWSRWFGKKPVPGP